MGRRCMWIHRLRSTCVSQFRFMMMERKENLNSNLFLKGFYAIPALHTFSLTLAKFPQLTLIKMSVEIAPAYRIRARERAHL